VAPSDASLWRAIQVLADAGDEGEQVDTPGGFWLGRVIEAKDEQGKLLKLRSVRTWIETR
jgi:hypothetical protein